MRTPKEARLYLRGQADRATPFKSGMCKQKSREAYLIPSDGSKDATEAWGRTRYRIVGSWVPGAFLWWTGGGAGHGHVAIAGVEPGVIYTVDFPRVGHWNKTTVAELEKAWPRIVWAGMSLDIDGRIPRPRLPYFVRRWNH